MNQGPQLQRIQPGAENIPQVDQLLAATGISLANGGDIPEYERFQDHFQHYRFVVYTGLNCEKLCLRGV